MSAFLAYLSQSFANAQPYLWIPLVIIAVIIIILLIILVAWIVYKTLKLIITVLVGVFRYGGSKLLALWRGRRKPVSTEEASPYVYLVGPNQSEASTAKKCFKYVLNLMRRLGRSTNLYQIPWYLVIGESNSGKSSLIQDSGLGFPFGTTQTVADADASVWVTGEAVMIEAHGPLLETEDNSKFKQLIKQLIVHRPRRPVDGLILTVSIHTLEAGLRNTDALVALAQHYMDLFALCETHIGFRLPVYVVVTHLDQKKEFNNFAFSLDELQARGMFGWSNPKHPDETFDRLWIDEAMTTLEQDIVNLWLTQPASAQVSSAGVQLPSTIARLKEAFNILFSRMFRTGQHFQSFSLRGLYFTGRTMDDTIIDSDVLTEIGGHRYFLHDFFLNKVFPEQGLSQPLSFYLQNVTFRYRITAIASITVIGLALISSIIGMVNTYDNSIKLQRISTNLETELSNSWASISSIDFSITPEPEIIDRIANVIVQYQEQSFIQGFVPASWFSSIPQDIRQINAHLIRGYLLKHLRINLGGRLDRAIALRNAIPPTVTGSSLVREYGILLRRYVDDVALAEDQLSLYEAFLENPQEVDLISLLSYAFDQDLQWSPNLSKIITEDTFLRIQLDPIDRLSLSERATANFRQLLDEYIEIVYALNPLTQTAIDIQNLSQLILDQSNTITLDQLQDLQRLLNSAQDLVNRTDLAWITETIIQDDRVFNQVMGRIASNPLFGFQLATSLTLSTEETRREIRRVVDSFESPLWGRIYFRQGQGQNTEGLLQVTREAQNFSEAVNFYLSSSFFQTGEYLSIDQIISDQPFTWNIPRLSVAIQHTEEFDRYFSTPQPAITPQLGRTLRRIAGETLSLALETELVRAIDFQFSLENRFGSLNIERQIVEVLANFNAARTRLDIISRSFASYSPEKNAELATIISTQVVDLLAQAHALLREEDPYGFLRVITASADPQQNANAIIAVGLEERLNEARERLRILYQEFASASLEILETRRTSGIFDQEDLRQVDDWNVIKQVLEGYERQETDNVLIEIERLARQMSSPDGNVICQAARQVPEERPRISGYLGTVLLRTTQALFDRCSAWQTFQVRNSIRQFTTFYSNSVVGAIPFAATNQATSSVSVPVFTQLLSRYRTLRQNLSQIPNLRQFLPVEWVSFLQTMDTIAQGFPLSEGDQGEFVDVHIEFDIGFRIRDNLSQLADQVIEWQLRSGQETLTDRDVQVIRTWRYNNPVTLSLRWAKDSLYRPKLNSDTINLGWSRVDETTIEITFSEPWSLFQFIETFAVSQDTGTAETLLQISLPVHRPADNIEGTLSAFLSIRFYDGGQLIAFPRFPHRLPPPINLTSSLTVQ